MSIFMDTPSSHLLEYALYLLMTESIGMEFPRHRRPEKSCLSEPLWVAATAMWSGKAKNRKVLAGLVSKCWSYQFSSTKSFTFMVNQATQSEIDFQLKSNVLLAQSSVSVAAEM